MLGVVHETDQRLAPRHLLVVGDVYDEFFAQSPVRQPVAGHLGFDQHRLLLQKETDPV
jgi:hypothetical protein